MDDFFRLRPRDDRRAFNAQPRWYDASDLRLNSTLGGILMRRILICLFALVLCVRGPAAETPNIIFILADDQDHLRISSLSITAKCEAISGISSS